MEMNEENLDKELKCKREMLSNLQNLYFINKYIIDDIGKINENQSFKYLIKDKENVKLDYKLFYNNNGFELKTNLDYISNDIELNTIFLIPMSEKNKQQLLSLNKNIYLDFLLDIIYTIKNMNLELSDVLSLKDVEKALDSQKRLYNGTFIQGINNLSTLKIIENNKTHFIFSKLIANYINNMLENGTYNIYE